MVIPWQWVVMIRNTKAKSVEKVPVLGDIPILGTLFRREEQTDEDTELILLITPYIVNKGEELEEVTRKRVLDGSQYDLWDTEQILPRAVQPEQLPPGTIEEDLELFEENPIQPKSRIPSSSGIQSPQANLDDNETKLTPVMELVKAASEIRKPDTAIRIPVEPGVPTPLFNNRNLVAYPQFTWKKDNLYVTRVIIKNIGKKR